MTEIIRCGSCGFLLYYGETIADRMYLGGLDEEKVLKRYPHGCPHCGGALRLATVTTTITE